MDFLQASAQLLTGFGYTLALFSLTLIISVPLGVIIACMLKSRFQAIRRLTELIVLVVRGTPLMLQLIIVFYMPGLWFGIPVKSRFNAVLIAFSFNYACYFSVIFKGGFDRIPSGQYEAGLVLGLSKFAIFFKILLPQILKSVLPPVSNEVITLVKDTSLARIISVTELLKAAEQIQNLYGVVWPVFYAGLFYLLFSGLLTLLFRLIEKKTAFIKP